MFKALGRFFCTGWRWFNNVFIFLTPFGDLLIRLWLAKIFFMSALTKVQTWDTTVFLFTHEYNVPLLSPKMAAILGTGVELVAPILIAVGLFGRLPTFILFVFNIMAVVSYPYLFTDAGQVGLQQHIYWGLLLLMVLLHGYGKLSLDSLFCWMRSKCSK